MLHALLSDANAFLATPWQFAVARRLLKKIIATTDATDFFWYRLIVSNPDPRTVFARPVLKEEKGLLAAFYRLQKHHHNSASPDPASPGPAKPSPIEHPVLRFQFDDDFVLLRKCHAQSVFSRGCKLPLQECHLLLLARLVDRQPRLFVPACSYSGRGPFEVCFGNPTEKPPIVLHSQGYGRSVEWRMEGPWDRKVIRTIVSATEYYSSTPPLSILATVQFVGGATTVGIDLNCNSTQVSAPSQIVITQSFEVDAQTLVSGAPTGCIRVTQNATVNAPIELLTLGAGVVL